MISAFNGNLFLFILDISTGKAFSRPHSDISSTQYSLGPRSMYYTSGGLFLVGGSIGTSWSVLCTNYNNGSGASFVYRPAGTSFGFAYAIIGGETN
jgi:hypothetical protein